jgi:tripartite-type tricarboxylate transporter receptor subunit TctC
MPERGFRHVLFALFALFSCDLWAQAAASQSAAGYPARAIRLIVPFPPGGSDTVARLVARQLIDRLGQQIVVDNRPGAAGVIGTQLAAQAPADGYTLLFMTASLTITPSASKLPYDLSRDFAPISPVATGPLLVVVHPSVQATSITELIVLSKANPRAINYASSGTGSITHLAAELFRAMTGAEISHVPYKGTGPAQTEVMAGQVQLMFGVLAPALPHVRSGKLRALGVTSIKRSTLAPDIPTVSESGAKGYEAATWYGMLAPARTPEAILQKLSAHIEASLRDPDGTGRLSAMGFEPTAPMSRKEFGTYINAEIAKWSALLKRAGITLE